MSYKRAMDIDPSEKSKRAVVVVEIFDEPLPPKQTARGRTGTYINHLRPLLLEQSEFIGKMSELCNQMGLFERYFDDLRNRPDVKNIIAQMNGNEDDFDLWQARVYSGIRERYYAMTLKAQIADVARYALKSMQKEGILTWKDEQMLLPHITTPTAENRQREEAYRVETEPRLLRCIQEIRTCAEAYNSCLDADALIGFLDGVYSRDKIAEYSYQLNRSGRVEPFLATDEQKRALDNYNDYVRQCAYQEAYGLKELPELGQIPVRGEFWRNPYLAKVGREV